MAYRRQMRALGQLLLACGAMAVLTVAAAAQTPRAPAKNPFDTPEPAGATAGVAATIETPHLRLVTAIDAVATKPGTQHTLRFDVTPHPRIHVYAPGKHDYQVVGITLDQAPWFRASPTKYPPSETYHFVPLNERVEVYSQTFRLERTITVLSTPEARKALENQKTMTVRGKLEYQACDDKVCYAPQTIPVYFTLDVK